MEEIGRCCLGQETPRKGLENSIRNTHGLSLCRGKPAGLLELPVPKPIWGSSDKNPNSSMKAVQLC